MNKPVIILVGPQMGENIGQVARAMKNCSLEDLRIVNPRDGWPNERAIANSSGATDILDNAQLFETTAQAVSDLTRIYATTARARDMNKPVFTPQTLSDRIHTEDGRHGILFGPERTGLENDDVALCDGIVNVPLNPEFSSLNLAQAVLLISYQWYQSTAMHRDLTPDNTNEIASKDALYNMFDHLNEELSRGTFFKNPDMKPAIMNNIRNMFTRAELSPQEVNTLHGMIVNLTGRPRQKND